MTTNYGLLLRELAERGVTGQRRCVNCGRKFGTHREMLGHLAVDHYGGRRTWTCPCGYVFGSKQGYRNHMNRLHRALHPDFERFIDKHKPVLACECEAKFETVEWLRAHTMTAHHREPTRAERTPIGRTTNPRGG